MIDANIQPVTRAEALALITTRGREHGPDGKWRRTQFRAIVGEA